MPIHNQPQADALTRIIHVIRQTRGHGHADWHETAITNVLREHHGHPAPYPDIVQALVKYATTSDKPVPTFMFDALRGWTPPGHTPEPCEDHSTRAAHNCPDCWSEVKTRMRPDTHIGKHWHIPDTL